MIKLLINGLLNRMTTNELVYLLIFLRSIAKNESYMLILKLLVRYNKISFSENDWVTPSKARVKATYWKKKSQSNGIAQGITYESFYSSLLPTDIMKSQSFHNVDNDLYFSICLWKRILYEIMMKFNFPLKCVSLKWV